ncbi:MAG TPA: hypothetical protein VFT66_15600 [Roseiflexaceae bacterium]|nr:hypothetical protein [Roseiflexaceae bacterium]
MLILLFILALLYPIMPPPWDPPQPIHPPLTVDTLHVDGLALFVRGDGDVASVNVTTATPRCWRVHLADAAGQTYDAGDMTGCGPTTYTLYAPFVENNHANE